MNNPSTALDTFVAAPEPVVVRQELLGRQIASAIRRDIILGRLAPGTRLTQESLREVYDVSRIPIRDALLSLHAEGFVTRNARNQATVSEFRPEDLADTFRIEAALSGLTAERAAVRATDEELDDLRRIASEELQEPIDKARAARLTWEFHRSINKMARSPRLTAALRAVSVPFIQDFMRELDDWWRTSVDEHREIAAAICARDAEGAREATVRHFDHAADALSGFLSAITSQSPEQPART